MQKKAQTSEACKQIGPQKLEAWASGLVQEGQDKDQSQKQQRMKGI